MMIRSQKNLFCPEQHGVRSSPYLQFCNAKWIVSELVANMPPGLRRHMLDDRLRVQNVPKIIDNTLSQSRAEAIHRQRNKRQHKSKEDNGCQTSYFQFFSHMLSPSRHYQDSKMIINSYRSLYRDFKLQSDSKTDILELFYSADGTGSLEHQHHLPENDLQAFGSLFIRPLQRCLRYIVDSL